MNIENFLSENPNINVTINAADLLVFGQTIANNTAKTILEKHQEKLFTREEILNKFQICSATLWRWDKLGLISSKKIGRRRYYSESELSELISKKGNTLW